MAQSQYYNSKDKAFVTDAQNQMNALGAGLKSDGLWGPKTEAAYTKYGGQLKLNAPATGGAGGAAVGEGGVTDGGGGGGGGGAGGGVIAIFHNGSYSNAGTLQVTAGAGGAGGAKAGNGEVGGSGTSGSVGNTHIQQI